MLRLYTILIVSFALCLPGCLDSSPTPATGLIGPNTPSNAADEPCANECDDGDPCTDDSCNGSACEHVAIADCTVAACNSLGLMDAVTLTGLDDGAAWKIAARPSPLGDPGQ